MEIRSTCVLLLCGMICCTISSALKPDSDISIEDTVIDLKQKLKQMEDRLSALEKIDTSDLIQKATGDISVAVQDAEKRFLDEKSQLLSKMKEMETESTDARNDLSLKLNGVLDQRISEHRDVILKRIAEVETRCVDSNAAVQQAKNISSEVFKKVQSVEQEVAEALERERSKTDILQNFRDSLLQIEKNCANISYVSQLDENVQHLDEAVKTKFQSFQSELSTRLRQLEERCVPCGDGAEMKETLRNHSLELTALNAKLPVLPNSCEEEPPALLNGKTLNFERMPGSSVRYECNPRFFMVGNSTVRCKLGNWEGHPPVCGQFDSSFTLHSVRGRLQTDSQSIIGCLSDDNYKTIKFTRKMDTGQGSRLPKLIHQFMEGKPVFGRILYMPGEDRLNRFGAFQCKVRINSIALEIVTLKLPPSDLVELDALTPYKVANVNETLELEVNNTQKLEHPIKWRHNGVDVPEWDDQLRVEISNVQKKDSGIYECFFEGRRNEGVHALMRLIVRGCAADKYGEHCDQDCPPCYNGGVCHDTWGVCVCPAGFTGDNCEVACGGNRFGADCSKICSPPQKNNNTDELCASHLLCKPDPYGCSCAPGFKGSSCMERCEKGWYGADCKQTCHCFDGPENCDIYTGACSRGCSSGWTGQSCQIQVVN